MSLCRRFPLRRAWTIVAYGVAVLASAWGGAGCESRSSSPASRAASRPATRPAGPPSTGLLTDVTASAGITFMHDAVRRGAYLFPEINGAGCAFLDYDNDGWLDVYLVQSGRDLADPASPGKPNVLYHNRGDGTFEDVTERSGAGDTGYGQGVACGDYDNDGYVDIYVTNVGRNTLLHNNGDGTFTDVTNRAGVGDAGWGLPAAFLDYDADGRLDLYVGNYVVWSPQTDRRCRVETTGLRDYCGPMGYRAQFDVLYHNRGDGTFEDVSTAAGLRTVTGPAMSAICADFTDDGRVDIYVANDADANQLWVNQGDGSFVDRGINLGCAVSGDGLTFGSMGTNAEDLDGDGRLDLFMAHFVQQPHLLYLNRGRFFEDVSQSTRLAALTTAYNGFGAAFLDLFNDGEMCIYLGNGKGVVDPSRKTGGDPYAERDQVLAFSSSALRFEDITDCVGPAMDVEYVSRGVAVGDYDNDGDADVLINDNSGPARLLRNDAGGASGNHWLLVRCIGPDGRRDAHGAQVTVEFAGRRRRRDVIVNYSYASSCDPRLHFGLGRAERADAITVRWLDGRVDRWEDVRADQVFVARYDAGAAKK